MTTANLQLAVESLFFIVYEDGKTIKFFLYLRGRRRRGPTLVSACVSEAEWNTRVRAVLPTERRKSLLYRVCRRDGYTKRFAVISLSDTLWELDGKLIWFLLRIFFSSSSKKFYSSKFYSFCCKIWYSNLAHELVFWLRKSFYRGISTIPWSAVRSNIVSLRANEHEEKTFTSARVVAYLSDLIYGNREIYRKSKFIIRRSKSADAMRVVDKTR